MAITPELLVPSTFQHYLLGLFAVANNFPASGPFLTLSQGLPSSHGRRVIRLRTFSSLLLGFSGLSMLNATDPGDSHEKNFDVSHMDVGQMTSSAIVPISLPLTAGAGTMSTITVYAEGAHTLSHRIALFAAILVMASLIGLMFTFATRLTKMLGHVGMTVLIKVMGLFTLAIGVQFIATGASTILSLVTLKM